MIILRLAAAFILLGSSRGQVHRDAKVAEYDEFPHQVQIEVTFNNKNRGMGTGTLILDQWDEQWVLTAAHNFQTHPDHGRVVEAEVLIPSRGLRAEAGAWLWDTTRYNLFKPISQAYDYDELDLLLVKLKTNLMDGDGNLVRVQAARLPEENDRIEDWSEVRFAGYGLNDRGLEDTLLEGRSFKLPGFLSNHLQHELDTFNEEDHTKENAEKIYRRFEKEIGDEEKRGKNKHFEESSRHILTGVRKPTDQASFSGTGDSGCGLFKLGDATVHGVLSAGDMTAEGEQQFTRPIIWVKVASELKWIKAKMNRHSDKGRRQVAKEGNSLAVVVLAVVLCAYFL